jgi:hypothetical protein
VKGHHFTATSPAATLPNLAKMPKREALKALRFTVRQCKDFIDALDDKTKRLEAEKALLAAKRLQAMAEISRLENTTNG